MPTATDSLREEVEALVKEGLFQSAWTLASFLTSDKSMKKKPEEEAKDWALFGDAAFGLESFSQAKGFYEKALMVLRNSRCEAKSLFPILLRCADCALRLRDSEGALEFLTTVPFDHRPLRHSLCIARLYERSGKREPAIQAYQEIINRTQGHLMVVEALQALARLGINARVFGSKGRNREGRNPGRDEKERKGGKTYPFVQKLVAVHGFAAKYKLGLALTALRDLRSAFPDNLALMLRQATLLFDLGQTDEALDLFRRCRSLFPRSSLGVDTFALALRTTDRQAELTRLMRQTLRSAPETPEPWIAVALDLSSDQKAAPKKALEVLGRLLQLHPNHPGALLAKGYLHLSHNDGKRASSAYQKVKVYSTGMGGVSDRGGGPGAGANIGIVGKTNCGCGCEPSVGSAYSFLPRFSVFQGLVEAYLQMHENKRALGAAKQAHQLMPHNPKSLTLIGLVLSQSDLKEKACKYFKSALRIDPKCVDAVDALSRFYHSEKDYDSMIDLLKGQMNHFSSRRDLLHVRLGDAYRLKGRIDLALEEYHKALALTPDMREAVRGIEMVENAGKEEDMNPEEIDDEDDM